MAKACHVRANVLLDAIGEDRQGGARPLITRFHFFDNLTHVTAAAKPQEPALLVQQRIQFAGRQFLVPGEKQENRRIDVTTASAHHQAREGRQARGGVDAAAACDSRHARAVAEVKRNQVQLSQ